MKLTDRQRSALRRLLKAEHYHLPLDRALARQLAAKKIVVITTQNRDRYEWNVRVARLPVVHMLMSRGGRSTHRKIAVDRRRDWRDTRFIAALLNHQQAAQGASENGHQADPQSVPQALPQARLAPAPQGLQHHGGPLMATLRYEVHTAAHAPVQGFIGAIKFGFVSYSAARSWDDRKPRQWKTRRGAANFIKRHEDAGVWCAGFLAVQEVSL